MSDFLRFLLLIIVLVGIWALLSGKFDVLHLGAGVLTATGLAAYYFPWGKSTRFPIMGFIAFIPWQLWQILLSNLRVARLVMRREVPNSSVLILQKPGVKSDRALVLLGCAITLTPGTLTVEIDEEHLLVHALDPESQRDVEQGTIAAKVRSVFGEEA